MLKGTGQGGIPGTGPAQGWGWVGISHIGDTLWETGFGYLGKGQGDVAVILGWA